jgi:hypothetical protein
MCAWHIKRWLLPLLLLALATTSRGNIENEDKQILGNVQKLLENHHNMTIGAIEASPVESETWFGLPLR